MQQSVPAQTDAMALSLNTLVTSESMLNNGWYANASPDPQYYYQYSPAHWWYCSEQGPNIYSCKGQGYFFSNASGRYYELKKKKHGSANGVELLQSIAQYGWADMNTLFDGAYNCTAEGEWASEDPSEDYSPLPLDRRWCIYICLC